MNINETQTALKQPKTDQFEKKQITTFQSETQADPKRPKQRHNEPK